MDDGNSQVRQIERRNEELRTLVEVGKTLTSTLEIEEILRIVMEKVGGLLRSKIWSLLLAEETTGELVFEIAVSPVAERIRGMRLERGEGIAGWVATHGEPVLIADAQRDPRFSQKVDRASSFTTHSVVCVPIRSREKVLGVIQLVNTLEEGSFEEPDLSILTTVADFVAIAVENARHVKKINELAVIDDLTGLYNARYFHSLLDYELERARRDGSDLSLVFIDLDRFKAVNDTHGHLAGSRILAELGGLLKTSIRKVDLAARYGGDEFVLVLPATPKQGAIDLASKLRRLIRDHAFGEDETGLRVTASFGIASFPEDARSKDELMAGADKAMYRAKETSRDAVGSA